jgi:hypothetical protein
VTLLLAKRDQIARRRAPLADGWLPTYRKVIGGELGRQGEDAAVLAERGDAVDDALRMLWAGRLRDAQLPLVLAMGVEGAQLAAAEVGGKKAVEDLVTDYPHFDPTTATALESVFEHNALLAQRLQPSMSEWVAMTAEWEADTSAKAVAGALEYARAERMTVAGTARYLREMVLTGAKARAERIARTATIWAYNDAAEQVYRDYGISAKEWLVTADDVTCEFCMAMSGQVVRVGEAFFAAGTMLEGEGTVTDYVGIEHADLLELPYAIEHPPLHPYCRCALMPVVTDGME